MIKLFLSLFLTAAFSVLLLAGRRGEHFSNPPLQLVPDMKHQPKQIAQHASLAFADSRADRPPVHGTVPTGYSIPGRYYQTGASSLRQLHDFSNSDSYASTGVIGAFYGSGVPLRVDSELLERGRERFEVFCVVCHDTHGSGNGVAKAFGLVTVASLLDDRVRQQPDGQLFSTITNGRNTMGAYGPIISVDDRWAIVAYVRALQIGSGTRREQLPSGVLDSLKDK